MQVATLCNSIYECFKFVKFLSSGKKERMKKKSIPKVYPLQHSSDIIHNHNAVIASILKILC